MKTLIPFALAATLAVASPAAAQTAKPSSDISGKWTLVVMADQNPITSDLEIKLDGKKVTGTVNNADRGTAPITGEFADGKLTFSLTMQGGGSPISVEFTGALKPDGTLAGTMNHGQPPDLNWTAERVKAKGATSPTLDVTGKWAMSLEMSVGTATPSLELALASGKITGKYAGRYGEYPVTGTLKDRTIEFSFTMSADGNPMTISFHGEVAPDGQSIKGSASMAEMGDASWTATRVKS